MVHVKFMAMVEDKEGVPQIASGIILNCPSVDALIEKLENDMGALVVNAEEATQEEVDNARRADE